MARIRSFTPDLNTDPKLARASDAAWRLYVGMKPYADDYGVVREDPDRLRLQVFAGRADVDVAQLVEELIGLGKLWRGRAEDGRTYLVCADWLEEERVKNPSTEKRCPAPEALVRPGETATRHPPAPQPSGALRRAPAGREGRGGEGNGVEGKGHNRQDRHQDGNGTGAGADRGLTTTGLPPSAVRLVELMYHDATPAKRQDAIEQLHDAIDPRRPGAQLDRDTWVQGSPEELEAACRKVLEKPPRNLHLSAKWVLHWIHGAQAKQATAKVESAGAEGREELAREERYYKARAKAATQWEKAHPTEAAAIMEQVNAELPQAEALGNIGATMRRSRFEALAAERIPFPPQAEWEATLATEPARS